MVDICAWPVKEFYTTAKTRQTENGYQRDVFVTDVCRGNSARDVADSGSLSQQALCSSSNPSDGYQLYHSRVSTSSLCLLVESLLHVT